MVDAYHALINSTGGSTYYVRVLSTLDREKLKPNTRYL
jgi:26S proteasome regulatory subunit T3